MMNEDAERIMIERFGKDSVLALATAENGVPSVRWVNAWYEAGRFYTVTYALSGKMRQIAGNPAVALAGEWFTAHGRGVDLGPFGSPGNAALAEKLKRAFAEWIDNGHTDLADENTVILCVELSDGLLLSHGTRYELRWDRQGGARG